MKHNHKLSMGPLLFNWKAEKWRDFYFQIADTPALDRIYIGEVVCSKRSPLIDPYFPEVLERLTQAGKEVVISTLALITSKREMKQIQDLSENTDYVVEANDITTLQFLAGRPHMAGPFINIYNEETLKFLQENGTHNICLPPELSKKSIETLADNTSQIKLEVQVFGRIPLALSARCYHARIHKLTKDSCGFICEQDPDGLQVDTLDGEPFMAINGIQTMSYKYLNLIQEIPILQEIGVTGFRISPHSHSVPAISAIYKEVIEARMTPEEGLSHIRKYFGQDGFTNGFFHGCAGENWIEF